MNKTPIHVTKPTLAPLKEFEEVLKGSWQSGILTHNGPLVQEFERKTKEFLNVQNMVATTNGTIALQMAIKALKLHGEIITTPFTWVATISSIIWERCIPVFVDIDPDTLNIDTSQIEDKVTSKTAAIMPVHVFGNSCNVDRIEEISNKYGLKVIYDAAHAVGVTYKGKSIFDYGHISVTSFHATKMLNTAEGGGCFTKDRELYQKLQRIRFFGHDSNNDIVEDGFNGKMTEVHAALGLINLKYLQNALDDREEKYRLYKERLSVQPNLKFQKITSSNYSYFPIIFDTENLMNQVITQLNKEGVYPRRYFYPSVNTLSQIIPYEPMPISEDISRRIACLPLYYDLHHEQIHQICDLVNKAL